MKYLLDRWRSHWRLLSRDARDSLFLLLTIAATMLPHARHLPLWCTGLSLLILLWRASLAWREAPLPGRRSLVLALLLTVTLTWFSEHRLIGREPGITMLALLMALKTLELRARRDAFVVFFLGFFLVLTQYLYSQSLFTALWSLGCVWALLSALVLAQMPLGQPQLRLAAGLAARNTLLGLPLMLALYLLFPRIAPLWGIPSDQIGHTGLSKQLQFGGLSEIASDDQIALRLRVLAGPAPDPRRWYFRGPVLSDFDGRTWRVRPDSGLISAAESLRLRPQVQGPALQYEITLEPLRLDTLPLLETSPEPPGSLMHAGDLLLQRGRDLQWLAPRPVTERLRFTQQAYAQVHTAVDARPADLEADGRLPPGLNPRSLAFAQALLHQARFQSLSAGERPGALASALFDHLRSNEFIYTLAPGRYGEATPHAIDEFWFDRRLGFCEHFAAAFVVMMRAMGVPARIVTGFQGADPEPQDGYWVVRNAQAHAWAEYWAPGQGWIRADPTAAVAPERVRQGLTLRPGPGFVGGLLGQVNPDLWRTLRGSWEQLDNRWQQWVLNYSRQDQFDLLKNIGFEQPDWQALGQLIAALIVVAAGLGGAWTLWSSRPHDAWSLQRRWLLARLHKLGVTEAALHQSPGRWAELLLAHRGDAAGSLAGLLQAQHRQRYAAGTSPAPDGPTRRQLARAWRRAERSLRRGR